MNSTDRASGRVPAAVGDGDGRTKLPRDLRVFWSVSLAAFALAALVSWAKFDAGQPKFNWDPLSDPLFGDMMEYPGTYSLLHTRAFFFNVAGRPWAYPMYSPVAYPPFAVAVMAPMYRSGEPELVFLTVCAFWLGGLVWWLRSRLVGVGISPTTAVLLPLTLALISFPIQRLVHQGNVELVVWVFTAVGVWSFWRGKDLAAASLWGAAAAMKLFPFVLLILLVPGKKWRSIAAGILVFGGASVFSMWWLGPTAQVAWQGTMKNVFGYQGMRMAEFSLRELIANHSLIGLAKIVALIARFPLAKLTLPYYALGAIVMVGAFFGRLWRMPRANQLLAVNTFMVMFPPISYYHALVHMYAPLIVLGAISIRAAHAGVEVKGLGKTMLLFIPLFVPFPLLMFPRFFVYCGMIQALALMAIFLFTMEYPFEVPGNEEATVTRSNSNYLALGA